jgi:uncharacterized membrane protein
MSVYPTARELDPVSRMGLSDTAREMSQMSTRAAVGIGAVTGLALGVLVSVTTDVPLAPEVGLVLGAVVGWLSRRGRV